MHSAGGARSRSGPMRVGLDATPLLGPRTGVGRYVAGLAGALATLAGPEPEELALVPFSWRGVFCECPTEYTNDVGTAATAAAAPAKSP